MKDYSSCLERKSSDSPAVDGLESGTSSDGPVVATMVINSIDLVGFNFIGLVVAQMDLNGSSSNDSTMIPSKTDMANSQLSKGIFLAHILKRLSGVGLVDFGVQQGHQVDRYG